MLLHHTTFPVTPNLQDIVITGDDYNSRKVLSDPKDLVAQ
jgi:hypothetical protein